MRKFSSDFESKRRKWCGGRDLNTKNRFQLELDELFKLVHVSISNEKLNHYQSTKSTFAYRRGISIKQRIIEYIRHRRESDQNQREILKERRDEQNRVVNQIALQSLDDSFELATTLAGIVILIIQISNPDWIPTFNIFNLFITGLLWVSYRVAKIKNAIDLRLLVIGFAYQIFAIWIIGLIVFPIIVIILLLPISFLIGIQISVNITIGLSFALLFIVTVRSRRTAKEFAKRQWDELVSVQYQKLSLIERYAESALSLVNRILPQPFFAFLLLFVLYWSGQPNLVDQNVLITWITILVIYAFGKAGQYLTVQEEVNNAW